MENLKELSKEELVALVIETRSMLFKAAQNLGHPSYDVSASAMICIDTLRDDIFDYLAGKKIQ